MQSAAASASIPNALSALIPPKCLQSQLAHDYVHSHHRMERALVVQPRRRVGTGNRFRVLRGYLFLAIVSQRALYIDWAHELSPPSRGFHKQEGTFIGSSSFDWTLDAYRKAHKNTPTPYYRRAPSHAFSDAEVFLTGHDTDKDITPRILEMPQKHSNTSAVQELLKNWNHCALRMLFNFNVDVIRTPVCNKLAKMPTLNVGIHVRSGKSTIIRMLTLKRDAELNVQAQLSINDMKDCALHLQKIHNSSLLGLFVVGDHPASVDSFVSGVRDAHTTPNPNKTSVHSGQGGPAFASLQALVDLSVLALSVTIIGSMSSSYSDLAIDLAYMKDNMGNGSDFRFYTGYKKAKAFHDKRHPQNNNTLETCKRMSSGDFEMRVAEHTSRAVDERERIIVCPS